MKVFPFLPPRATVEQDWTHSTITLGHLQKHGVMSAAELEACRVSKNPAVLLAVIKCIYLPPTYLHFMQDIEDRSLLQTSTMSFVDLPF
jgi:hypothetical protein